MRQIMPATEPEQTEQHGIVLAQNCSISVLSRAVYIQPEASDSSQTSNLPDGGRSLIPQPADPAALGRDGSHQSPAEQRSWSDQPMATPERRCCATALQVSSGIGEPDQKRTVPTRVCSDRPHMQRQFPAIPGPCGALHQAAALSSSACSASMPEASNHFWYVELCTCTECPMDLAAIEVPIFGE